MQGIIENGSRSDLFYYRQLLVSRLLGKITIRPSSAFLRELLEKIILQFYNEVRLLRTLKRKTPQEYEAADEAVLG